MEHFQFIIFPPSKIPLYTPDSSKLTKFMALIIECREIEKSKTKSEPHLKRSGAKFFSSGFLAGLHSRACLTLITYKIYYILADYPIIIIIFTAVLTRRRTIMDRFVGLFVDCSDRYSPQG